MATSSVLFNPATVAAESGRAFALADRGRSSRLPDQGVPPHSVAGQWPGASVPGGVRSARGVVPRGEQNQQRPWPAPPVPTEARVRWLGGLSWTILRCRRRRQQDRRPHVPGWPPPRRPPTPASRTAPARPSRVARCAGPASGSSRACGEPLPAAPDHGRGFGPAPGPRATRAVKSSSTGRQRVLRVSVCSSRQRSFWLCSARHVPAAVGAEAPTSAASRPPSH